MSDSRLRTKATIAIPSVLIRVVIVFFKDSFPEWRREQAAHLKYIDEFLTIRNQGWLSEDAIHISNRRSSSEHMARMIAITNGQKQHRILSEGIPKEIPTTTSTAQNDAPKGKECEYRNCTRILIMTGRSDKRFCTEVETGIKKYQQCRSRENKAKARENG